MNISEELTEAYIKTHYIVLHEKQFTLRIGKRSNNLLEIFKEQGVNCGAFVTACNPYSRIVSPEINTKLLSELYSILSNDYMVISGIAKDPESKWPLEKSFMVLGISMEDAMNIGRSFNQNALVWCGMNTIPKLLILTEQNF
tara:strand:- start:3415 stop:3840 length:426 start_codon:yes stop_codon:yes gene_type:complete